MFRRRSTTLPNAIWPHENRENMLAVSPSYLCTRILSHFQTRVLLLHFWQISQHHEAWHAGSNVFYEYLITLGQRAVHDNSRWKFKVSAGKSENLSASILLRLCRCEILNEVSPEHLGLIPGQHTKSFAYFYGFIVDSIQNHSSTNYNRIWTRLKEMCL